MAKKNKKNKKGIDRRRRAKKERRKKQEKHRDGSDPVGPSRRGRAVRPDGFPDPPLTPPRHDRLQDPVHFDRTGQTIESPRALLGLDAGERDPERIRAAWLEKLRLNPPEQDPEGARRLRDARDLLLDPQRWIERELGVVAVPDARAWGLPEPSERPVDDRLDCEGRLLGQLVMYALLEDTLLDPSVIKDAERQQSLF
jgi:hypothetical protein